MTIGYDLFDSQKGQNLYITPEQIESEPLTLYSGYFTENQGQWNESINFLARTEFGEIALCENSVFYNVWEVSEIIPNKSEFDKRLQIIPYHNIQYQVQGSVIKLSFQESNTVKPTGFEPLKHNNNYFYGNFESDWCTNITNFKKVIYENIWPGIDLAYYFIDNELKYEFIINPGGDRGYY